VRGRVGLATGPVLRYFTGGFAYGNVKTTFNDVNAGVSETFSNTRTGWTLGSGVEAALGGNWTGKIEYLYLDLGTQSGVGVAHAFSSDVRAHTFRAGLNYRIGGSGLYAAAPVANWAGFYGGLNAGGATALNRSSVAVVGAPTESFNLSPDGYLGGGQIATTSRPALSFYGLEADIQVRRCGITRTACSPASPARRPTSTRSCSGSAPCAAVSAIRSARRCSMPPAVSPTAT